MNAPRYRELRDDALTVYTLHSSLRGETSRIGHVFPILFIAAIPTSFQIAHKKTRSRSKN